MYHTFADEDAMRWLKGVLDVRLLLPVGATSFFSKTHYNVLCQGVAAKAHPRRRHLWLLKCTKLRPSGQLAHGPIMLYMLGFPFFSQFPYLYLVCRLLTMKYRIDRKRTLNCKTSTFWRLGDSSCDLCSSERGLTGLQDQGPGESEVEIEYPIVWTCVCAAMSQKTLACS